MAQSDKPISMRDVAELAGVSIATVSRVINGLGGFSEETRERVEKIIEENGYIANQAAKSLREARTHTIGMIIPDITNDFFSTLALQAERAFADEGYSVLICNDANDAERGRHYLRTLISKRVDGIICISGRTTFDENDVPGNVPIVYVDRFPERTHDIARVISDDLHGGRLATEHLIERGCERIAFMTGTHSALSVQNRGIGYEEALAEHGLAVDPALRIELKGRVRRFQEARETLAEVISSGVEFDGIFAMNDVIAVGALLALRDAGIRVPEEVKVVGFDDSIYASIATPALTSVRRFPEEMARRGCDTLLGLIEGSDVDLEQILPVDLVVRESTG